MAKTEIALNVDEDLLAKAQAATLDLSQVFETALRQRLAGPSAADMEWAQDSALIVEALAGGAEETKA